jgi:hypothetical protein
MTGLEAVVQNSADEQLSRVHWHILRCDSLRGSVASRAGTLLSTNALVVAGIALAAGWGSRRPGIVVIAATVVTFACVFCSAASAVRAAVSFFAWDRRFPGQAGAPGTVYCPAEYSGAESFEGFRRQWAARSAEQILDEALRELWQITRLHQDRYRWLRRGQRWLLVALSCLLITVGLAVS